MQLCLALHVTAEFTDAKALKLSGIPEDAKNVKVSVYKVGSDGMAALTAEAVLDKEYTIAVTADNYKLSLAKATYTSQQAAAAKAEEDAKAVSDQITNTIPALDKLTAADESKVKAAREAYNALSEEAKAKVPADVKKALEDAEAKITELKKAPEPAASTTTTEPAQTSPTTPAAPAKGAVLTAGNNKYKVTNAAANGKGTVTFTGLKKKTAAITVPATVKYNNITYKVTAIGAKAFIKNTRAKKIVIGANVQTIGAFAFANCTKAKTITIGKNVKTIGKQAFYNVKSAVKITVLTKKLTAKTVKAGAFKGAGASKGKKLTVTVPKAKKKAYKKLLVKKGLSKKAKIK